MLLNIKMKRIPSSDGLIQLVCVSLLIVVFCSMIQSSHQQEEKLRHLLENDTCLTTEGNVGICTKLSLCPSGIASINSGGRPKVCSFSDADLIICCPTSNSSGIKVKPINTATTESSYLVSTNSISHEKAVKKATEKCEEYGKTIFVEFHSPVLLVSAEDVVEQMDTCARIEEPLVVGGEKAKAKEFPHMVLIGYGEKNVIWLCGGSLISERFVLSAAHCSRSASLGEAKWAKVGELDTSTDMDDAYPDIIRIADRIVYPKYTRDLLYNDIALFKLERDVEISAYVRPLCLFTGGPFPQTEFIATGWGHTSRARNSKSVSSKSNDTEEEEDPRQKGLTTDEIVFITDDTALTKQSQIIFESSTVSEALMKVKLELVDRDNCDAKYLNSRGTKLPKGILDNSQLCAGDVVGKDTCQGDSGGPLQIPLKSPYCMYGLIGVTSFGKSCGTGYPGVYTRVSHFLPWIVENVWPEDKQS